MEETPRQQQIRENVLKVGICSLDEMEDKVKSFRVMNGNSGKKRYMISREEVKDPNGVVILKKAQEIDISSAKLLRRHFKSDHKFKTFQPDEGILIVSDMSDPGGISLTMDIVTQIMNLGGGAYEGFIDRVDSFKDFSELLKKTLFPKVVIIGYLPKDKIQEELASFMQVKKIDKYLRFLELTHSSYKQHGIFQKVKQIEISQEDPKSWGRFVVEVIKEYTRSYMLEEIN